MALYKELQGDELTLDTARVLFDIGTLYTVHGHHTKAMETLRQAHKAYLLLDPENTNVKSIQDQLLFSPGPYIGLARSGHPGVIN